MPAAPGARVRGSAPLPSPRPQRRGPARSAAWPAPAPPRAEVGRPGGLGGGRPGPRARTGAGGSAPDTRPRCGGRGRGPGAGGRRRGSRLPEQFQPVGVWQSLREVGNAASRAGRAASSSSTGSSSSQQKPSHSVQPPHGRGDSHSTMASSRGSAVASGFRGARGRGGRPAGYWASRGPRRHGRRRRQGQRTGTRRPDPRMIAGVSETSRDPAQPREPQGRPSGRAGPSGGRGHRAGLREPRSTGTASPGAEERGPRRPAGGRVRAPPSPAAAARALPPASLWRWGSSRSSARPRSRGRRQARADWPSGMQVPGGRGRRGGAGEAAAGATDGLAGRALPERSCAGLARGASAGFRGGDPTPLHARGPPRLRPGTPPPSPASLPGPRASSLSRASAGAGGVSAPEPGGRRCRGGGRGVPLEPGRRRAGHAARSRARAGTVTAGAPGALRRGRDPGARAAVTGQPRPAWKRRRREPAPRGRSRTDSARLRARSLASPRGPAAPALRDPKVRGCPPRAPPRPGSCARLPGSGRRVGGRTRSGRAARAAGRAPGPGPGAWRARPREAASEALGPLRRRGGRPRARAAPSAGSAATCGGERGNSAGACRPARSSLPPAVAEPRRAGTRLPPLRPPRRRAPGRPTAVLGASG